MSLNALTYMDLLVSAVLALIMFGIGLSINLNDLKGIYHSPKTFLYGLFAQMILLPLIAFGVTFFSDLPPAVKAGFIILAASPGGTTSGFITVLFRGNVALSIALTTVNSILTLFSIPLLVNVALTIYFGKHSIYELPFLDTLTQIFFVTLLPAITGVVVKAKWAGVAEKLQNPVRIIMMILFAGVYTAIFIIDESKGGSGIKISEALRILPYALVVNIAAFITGIFTGQFSRAGLKSSFTIGIEVAIHNTTLALLVAGTLIQSSDMVKPALVYAMFSFWTAALFSVIVKKSNGLKIFGPFAG